MPMMRFLHCWLPPLICRFRHAAAAIFADAAATTLSPPAIAFAAIFEISPPPFTRAISIFLFIFIAMFSQAFIEVSRISAPPLTGLHSVSFRLFRLPLPPP